MKPPEKCRHCGNTRVGRPRGLCWKCWCAPGVRSLYKSTSKYAVRGTGHSNTRAPAMFATEAWPGSDKKIEVMTLRASLHQDVFHPKDAVPA